MYTRDLPLPGLWTSNITVNGFKSFETSHKSLEGISQFPQRRMPENAMIEGQTMKRTSLTNNYQVREFWIYRPPTDILQVREPVVFVPGRFVEKPVINKVFEEVGVIE